jgi:glycosyltransferase involved in cell wall biosynthesis
MAKRVLHVLAQRPARTGSGVTLEALVREAGRAGWQQWVCVGTPLDDPQPIVSDLGADRVRPLRFGEGELPFALPGMSDVMPYPSSRFSALDDEQVRRYLDAWRAHLRAAIDAAEPQVIHCHHLWLVSSLLAELAPPIPVVAHCHATGLRQRALAPALAPLADRGNAKHPGFAVLHGDHARLLVDELGVDAAKVRVVGAGYRQDVFFGDGATPRRPHRVLYVGKRSAAKGVPELLDAFSALRRERPEAELHIVGGGAGEESETIDARIAKLPGVVLHGLVSQPRLVELMRSAAVCVLPSYYEGVPLVLVEAFACGCRLVATALPGVVEQLAPPLGDALELVSLPSMAGIDHPDPASLEPFVAALSAALTRALDAPPLGDPAETRPEALAACSWSAVFQRVEALWSELSPAAPRGSEAEPPRS